MKIRDSHASINNDKTEYEMPSGGLDIIADDGRTLFSIRQQADGSIEVHSGSFAKHNGKLLHDRLEIRPRSANNVIIFRPLYPIE